MQKQISYIWLPIGFTWVFLSFFIANELNNIPRSTETNVNVPVCYQSSSGTSPLLSSDTKNCVADRTTYGKPFPYVSTYALKEPITNSFSNGETREVTRYTGLLGQELTTADRTVKRYGNTLMGWNYLTVLIFPFIVYALFSGFRRYFASSDNNYTGDQ